MIAPKFCVHLMYFQNSGSFHQAFESFITEDEVVVNLLVFNVKMVIGICVNIVRMRLFCDNKEKHIAMRKKCTCIESAALHLVPYSKLIFKTLEEAREDPDFHIGGMYVCRVTPYQIYILFAERSMYRAAKRVEARRKQMGMKCCFARVPAQNWDHKECQRNFIKRTYADTPFDSTYLHVLSTPLSWWVPQLSRAEVYGPEGPEGKKWSFPMVKRKAGIYLIWENNVLRYVGQSTTSLSETANNHFSPFKEKNYDNRWKDHYRVCFAETKFTHKYEIAFVEISRFWFTSEQDFRSAVDTLEKGLIRCFSDTLFNVKDMPSIPSEDLSFLLQTNQVCEQEEPLLF